jgi:cAMP phosphodiesterase
MRFKVLGCSGGIGGMRRTTSFLVDDDILIDAGTGVGDLSLDALQRIDHVFVTHAHLDHICSIPFLVDSVARLRDKPLTVYAVEGVLATLREHVFNWAVWPDFTRVPNADTPFMRYQTLRVGEVVVLGGRAITPIPAEHVVPAVGYHLDSGVGSLVFTGDTTVNPALWPYLNGVKNLRYLLIETAFCEAEKSLAVLSKHLCPSMLAMELAQLKQPAEIFITHLKPGEDELTMREIAEQVQGHSPRELRNGDEFQL